MFTKSKKTFSLLLILALLFSLTVKMISLEVFASAVPWDEADIKLNVYCDLNDIPDQEVVLGTQSVRCIAPKTETKITADIKDGSFRITSNPDGEHPSGGAMILDLGGTLSFDELEAAEGAGFYFENHMPDGVWIIAAHCFGDYYKRIREGGTYYLVESDNMTGISRAQSPNQGQIYIPKDFKGYVYYYLSEVKQSSESFKLNNAKANFVGLRFGGVPFTEQSGSYMLWDNFFVWGENVKDNSTLVSGPELNSLVVENAVLDAEFDPSIKEYWATVHYDVKSVRISAEADPNCIVKCNGIIIAKGEWADIAVMVGRNDIEVSVTDQNGVSATTRIVILRRQDEELLYNEELRPQFHFTQYQYSLNDPNGLVYNEATGEYHMYFQSDDPFHTPYAVEGNNKSWGHAVSKDLVNWEVFDRVIEPDENGTIWSGSCVVDKNNTSGFFDESTIPEERIVALFTYYGGTKPSNGLCSIGIAYSADGGYTFNKPFEEPIIPNTDNMYQAGMRDPKVFWLEGKNGMPGTWVMIVAGGRSQIFTSSDLINWERDSELCFMDGTPMDSECPDLYPLAVDGDENNIKWIYSGGGVWYIIGDLVYKEDGKLDFIAQTEKLQYVNGISELFPGSGEYPEMYAAQTFYNDKLGRRIEVSWVRDLVSAPGKVWYNALSIPQEIQLVTINGELRLIKTPVEELKSLRTETVFTAENLLIGPQTDNPLKNINEKLFEIEAVFQINDAKKFGFDFRMGEGECTTVYYDAERNMFITSKNNSSKYINGSYFCRTQAKDGLVSMRIIVDSSMIDVYGMDGQVFHNGYTFASPESKGMRMFSEGGEVTVKSVTVYRLKGMDRNAVTNSGAASPSPGNSSEVIQEGPKSNLGLLLGAGGAVLVGACILTAFGIKRKR